MEGFVLRDSVERRVPVSTLNYAAHVDHALLLVWMHDLRAAYLCSLGYDLEKSPVMLTVYDLSLKMRRPMLPGDTVRVDSTWHFKGVRAVCAHILYKDGEECACVDVRMACVAPGDQGLGAVGKPADVRKFMALLHLHGE